MKKKSKKYIYIWQTWTWYFPCDIFNFRVRALLKVLAEKRSFSLFSQRGRKIKVLFLLLICILIFLIYLLLLFYKILHLYLNQNVVFEIYILLCEKNTARNREEHLNAPSERLKIVISFAYNPKYLNLFYKSYVKKLFTGLNHSEISTKMLIILFFLSFKSFGKGEYNVTHS